MLIATNLPNPAVITRHARSADMISISFEGLRGEDDPQYQGLKPERKAVGKSRGDQDKVLGGRPG
jgi:hypothetical protein